MEGFTRYQFREKGSEFGCVDELPEYPPGSHFFSLRIHYKGIYFEEPYTQYIGGEVVISDYVHPRNLHFRRLDATSQYLGYGPVCMCWYKKPGKMTNNAMELFVCDGDIRDMAMIGMRQRVLDIFMLGFPNNFLPWDEPPQQMIAENNEDVEQKSEWINMCPIVGEYENFFVQENDVEWTNMDAIFGVVPENDGAEIMDDAGSSQPAPQVSDIDMEELNRNGNNLKRKLGEEDGNTEWRENIAGSPIEEPGEKFEDSDYAVEEDSDVEDLMAQRKEWIKVMNYKSNEAGPSSLNQEKDDSDPDWVEPGDDIDSEGLHSQSSSDSDGDDLGKRQVRVMNRFVPPNPTGDVRFEVGQIFISRSEFEVACKHHGIIDLRKIRIKRSNPKRCTAHCKTPPGKCSWIVSINYRKRTECWELTATGIPCSHAIAAINMTKEEPLAFVDAYYSKEAYHRAYKYIIYPINGPELWEKAEGVPLLPHRVLRLPGRPQKSRKKHPNEKLDVKIKKEKRDIQNLPRVGNMAPYKCRECGQYGHNKQRCPTKETSKLEKIHTAGQASTSAIHPLEKLIHEHKENDATTPAKASPAKPLENLCPKPKRKRKECSHCHRNGHNKTTCTSSVADVKFRPPIDSVMNG